MLFFITAVLIFEFYHLELVSKYIVNAEKEHSAIYSVMYYSIGDKMVVKPDTPYGRDHICQYFGPGQLLAVEQKNSSNITWETLNFSERTNERVTITFVLKSKKCRSLHI